MDRNQAIDTLNVILQADANEYSSAIANLAGRIDASIIPLIDEILTGPAAASTPEIVPLLQNIKEHILRILPNQQNPIPPSRDLSAIIKNDNPTWQQARLNAYGGPRVLMAPSMGGYQHGALVESIVAAGLTLRGAQVDILLCDGCLNGCQLSELENTKPEELRSPQPRCHACVPAGRTMFEPLGLNIHWLGQHISPEQRATAARLANETDLKNIGQWRYDGLAVGEHALAGALRYFASGDLHNEPQAESVTRSFLEAALLTVFGLRAILENQHYDVACFNHGIYVPQGLIGEVCRQSGLRVVTWNPAYRKPCFIFSHDDTYHHTMISEPTGLWEDLEWTPTVETITMDYLKSRWQGTQDWIWFHDQPEEDLQTIATEIGLDFERPWISLLTNVMWDAQLHYGSNAFPNMLAWVFDTIEFFKERPDLQLIIRVHPAEIRGMLPSRQLMVDEIRQAYPALPENVFIVAPESQISTYALVQNSNAAIIYNTKTGIEISSTGIPVIVAGEAWIRDKGFSLDASSPAEYRELLSQLPLDGPLNADELARARRYAFHFFFRRMIPLNFIEQAQSRGKLNVRLNDLTKLAPGGNPGLDVICNGILNATPFIYPAEETPTTLDPETNGVSQTFKDDLSWEEKARQNPLYAVMSAEQFADKNADPDTWSAEDLEIFFNKGQLMFDCQLKPLILRVPLIPGEAFIIEYGSGMGRILKHIQAAGFDCAGIDISESMLEYSRKLVPAVTKLFGLNSQGRCALPDGTADLVYCYAVLQHINELSRVRVALLEMARLLKPGGLLKFQFRTLDNPFAETPVKVENFETYSLIQSQSADQRMITERREHTNWIGVPLSMDNLQIFLAEGGLRLIGIEEDVGPKKNMLWALAGKD